jgi:hypothetical protein
MCSGSGCGEPGTAVESAMEASVESWQVHDDNAVREYCKMQATHEKSTGRVKNFRNFPGKPIGN